MLVFIFWLYSVIKNVTISGTSYFQKNIASTLINKRKDRRREDLQYISQDKKEFTEEDLLKTLKN